MKLVNLAIQNKTSSGRVAYNAAMYLAMEEHDGKEVLVCRPQPALERHGDFMDIFRQLGNLTASLTSPHILRCRELGEDEKGVFWFMGPGKYMSMAQAMVNRPLLRTDTRWIDNAIRELMEATQQAHEQGLCFWEFTPHSVLVSRDTHGHIALLPPLSPFMSVREVLYPTPTEAVAPELGQIEEEEPDTRADVYGIGRIIKYLHPSPSLPFQYNAPTHKALSPQKEKRPASPAQMLTSIQSRRRGGALTHIVVSVSAVLALAALIFFFPWAEDEPLDLKTVMAKDSLLLNDSLLTSQPSMDPLVNTSMEALSDAERDRMLNNYLNDSSYLSLDTAVTLSPERREYEKKMMKVAAEKFRDKFRQQAMAILTGVYTDENLVDQKTFMDASMAANQQLVLLQDALARQYQLDPSTAVRIAAEVQDEVIENIKRKRAAKK